MMEFLCYEGKVAVALLVFYLFYRFLLKKETFHRFNRVVLVGTAVLSFLLPLCIITIRKPVEMEPVVTEPIVGVAELAAVAEPAPTPWWPVALTALFWAGVAFVLIRVAVSIFCIARIVRRGERVREEDGCKIIVTDRDLDPFSWMRYIVLSRKDWEGDHAPILAHEKAHIAYGHSLDLLLVDILSALQWFNPAIWMLRADLQELHEYEADDAVLRSGADLKEYQYLLIRKAVSKSGYSVANSFNHSILKNRITMMSKSKSSIVRGLRALYLLPLICLGLGLQAKTVYVPEDKDSNIQEKNITIQVDADGKIVIEGKEYQLNEITSYLQSLQLPGHEIIASMDAVPETPEAVMRELLDQLGQAGVTKVRYRAQVVTPLYILHDVSGEEREITREELNMIDSEEIQSVDLLQEPEALERYGEKAGNGVVIITIKSSQAQSTSDATDNDRTSREKMKSPVMLAPRFQYGNASQFGKWVASQLVYPKPAWDAGMEGCVVVSYDVCEDGNVRNVKVLQGVNEQLDEEAVRVVSSSPRWQPALLDNEPVKVTMELPVVFRLRKQTISVEGAANRESPSLVQVPAGQNQNPLIILRQAWGEEHEITKEEYDNLDSGRIKSVGLMKDADAWEKYGEKAAHGVIVITLKMPTEMEEIVVVRYRDQEDDDKPVKFYPVEPDTMPKFQGGDINMFSRWLCQQITAPKDCNHEGTMKVSFVVGADGSVSDVKVVQSVCAELDALAVSTIEKSPKWEPATINGKPYDMALSVPIVFQVRHTPKK